jgi:hypothetical protein
MKLHADKVEGNKGNKEFGWEYGRIAAAYEVTEKAGERNQSCFEIKTKKRSEFSDRFFMLILLFLFFQFDQVCKIFNHSIMLFHKRIVFVPDISC